MERVLIANRGEIAVRVARACAELGMTSIAVYADDDLLAKHVDAADEAYGLGPGGVRQTYLSIERLLEIARESRADAVHPGYGFLAEDGDFAEAVIGAGLTWIGPSPGAIRRLGDKVSARAIAQAVGAPLAPGSDGAIDGADELVAFAERHGLPVAIKAAFGGGGRGIRVVRDLSELESSFAEARSESLASFGRDEVFVERFLDRPRHIEVQFVADVHGNVLVAGTRDCSVQRRNQKLVEEAPAPDLTAEERERLHASAAAIAREAGYVGAGTVEYLRGDDGTLSFLEVNTRIQVEHCATEEAYGIDLVRLQFEVARGERVADGAIAPTRHAIEFRFNAEDPARGFLPSTGVFEAFELPGGPGVRVDTGYRAGDRMPVSYDSLIAKLIVADDSRGQALRRARRALREVDIRGVATTVPFHRALLDADAFAGELRVHTQWAESAEAQVLAIALADPFEDRSEAPRVELVRADIEIDGRRVRLRVPAELLQAGLAAAPGGGSRRSTAPEPSQARSDGAQLAEFAGTVVSWAVAEGDRVEAGDVVLVMETMKMESRVTAARAGVVVGPLADAGAAIGVGDVLFTLK